MASRYLLNVTSQRLTHLDGPPAYPVDNFVSRAYSWNNDGVVMTTFTVILTILLELCSLDAVSRIVSAKQGAQLYAKGVAMNVVNNCLLGPLAYELVSTCFMAPPLSGWGRVGMVTAILVGHAIGYYLAHRWMHTKQMYWAHRFHHRFNMHVAPVTANAVSLAEYAVAYMAPFILGSALLQPDRLSLFVAVGIISLNNLLIHTPRLADLSARLVPWLFVSTEMHLEHHRKLTTHWAAPTISIDRLIEYFVGTPGSYGKEFKDD